MKTSIDFINGGTRKFFAKMALPMMVAMFLNLAYNIVDSIWIGNLLGESAMAALTSALPVILILTSVGMGATSGLSILLSQKIGADEKPEKLIAVSFLASVGFTLVLTFLLELKLPMILKWLGTPEEIAGMAYDYLSVYLLGYAAVFLYLYFTAVLRSYGNTTLQATAILLCTVLNGILDPLFIRWIGFHGAAAATLISQVVSAFILGAYLYQEKKFVLRLRSFDVRLLWPLLKHALPSVVQQSLPAISTSFLTALVSGFGITAIAGYGIAGKLEMLMLYPAMAFQMVLTVITGQCIGGERADRAKDYVWCGCLYGGVGVLLMSLLVFLLSGPLSGVFVSSPEIAEVVSGYFMIVGIGYVFNTVTNCMLGAVNGFGKPMTAMLLMVCYYLVIRMPLAWLLSGGGLGISGIWIATAVSHGVAALLTCVMYKRLLGRRKEALVVS